MTSPLAVIICHSSDADVEPLARAIRDAGVSTRVWFFDGRDQDIDVDATVGSFQLGRSGQWLSNDDLRRAAVVIHRVGLGLWSSPVLATRGTPAERRFAEREWATLLSSIMLDAEERYPHVTWINRPSASIVSSQKHHLLSTADLDGIEVARYRVSTRNLLPDSESGEWVCKAINEDEEVDEERTFASARLPDELVRASPFHTTCPSHIQERIAVDHELRVYHLLGRTLGLRLTAPGREYVDIRLLPRETIQAVPVEVEAELTEKLYRYCHRRRLAFCVFDFLVMGDGRCRLVDVTPGGTWSFYEPAGDPFISSWYARVVADSVVESALPAK